MNLRRKLLIIKKKAKCEKLDTKQSLSSISTSSDKQSLQDKNIKSVTNQLISIIILTFNQLKYTRETIKSIRQYTKNLYELIIVDNFSTDGTSEYVSNLSNVKFILNKINLGFAAGCNQGITAAEGDYILLLNNDTIVNDCWLENLLKYFKISDNIGIVGPITNYISGPQIDRGFPNGLVKFDQDLLKGKEIITNYSRNILLNNYNKSKLFPRITAFCMLIKREVLEKLGGLDERFGIGNYEDDDFCLRVQKLGYKSLIASDVFIYHFGSKSFELFGKEKYNEQIIKNKNIFINKWGIDPEQIWLKGQEPNKNVSLFCELRKNNEFINNNSKNTISLCMIVKNEGENLRNCLDSIFDIVDEIIIVDTGSSDNTIEIAKSFNAKIYNYKWKEDFSAARNFSIEKANSDWILILDADEILDHASILNILRLKNSEDIDAFSFEIYNTQNEDSISKYDVFRLTRFFRNKRGYRYSGIVHEQVRQNIESLGGKIVDVEVKIFHFGYYCQSKEKIARNLYLLRKAIQNEPENSYLHYQIGTIFFTKNDFENALKHFQISYSLHHERKSYLSREIIIKLLMKMSQLYLKEDNYQKSIEYTVRALEFDPSHPLLSYLLAANYFMEKRYSEALDVLVRIENEMELDNRLAINKFLVHFDKGNCWFFLHQFENAFDEYKKALEINPGSVHLYYNLGNTLIKLGYKDEAKKMFEKSLEIKPDFQESQIKMNNLR